MRTTGVFLFFASGVCIGFIAVADTALRRYLARRREIRAFIRALSEEL